MLILSRTAVLEFDLNRMGVIYFLKYFVLSTHLCICFSKLKLHLNSWAYFQPKAVFYTKVVKLRARRTRYNICDKVCQ